MSGIFGIIWFSSKPTGARPTVPNIGMNGSNRMRPSNHTNLSDWFDGESGTFGITGLDEVLQGNVRFTACHGKATRPLATGGRSPGAVAAEGRTPRKCRCAGGAGAAG